MQPDVEIHNHGSVVLVAVLTDAAQSWVDENVGLEGWQWMGNAFSCEPRMVQDLIDGMESDGLNVEV